MTRDVYKDCMKLINEIESITNIIETKHHDTTDDVDSIREALDNLYDLIYEEVHEVGY